MEKKLLSTLVQNINEDAFIQLSNDDYKELGILIGTRKRLINLQNLLKPSSSSAQIQPNLLERSETTENLNNNVVNNSDENEPNINFEIIDQRTKTAYTEVINDKF